MRKRIVLIVAGQPSTNPRLVKSIEALADKYELTVLYSFWTRWADENDRRLFDQYPQVNFVRLGGHPSEGKGWYLLSRMTHKCARILAHLFPASLFLTVLSLTRSYVFLLHRAKRTKADMYLSYNLGALPVAVLAAEKNGAASVADLEDFYRGQWVKGSKNYRQSRRVEECFITRTHGCISASPMISEAYGKLFPKVKIHTVLNVFSKKNLQALPEAVTKQTSKGLKLFWFSQTVGRKRGLEETIEAMGRIHDRTMQLTILGYCSPKMRDYLFAFANKSGVFKKQLVFIQPQPLESIFKLAANHDIGLALEVENTTNRNICLTNKIFTYLLSGVAIVASDTPAQVSFLRQFPSIGFIHRTGDAKGLVNLFNRLMTDADLIHRCRQSALHLAAQRWNWEVESKIYTSLIDSFFS